MSPTREPSQPDDSSVPPRGAPNEPAPNEPAQNEPALNKPAPNEPAQSPPNPAPPNPTSQSEPQQQQPHQIQLQQQQQQFLARPMQDSAQSSQSQNAAGASRFFATYQPRPGVYDEVLDPQRNLRPHWSKLTGELEQVGEAGLEHRWKQIRRMVRQNGIAYSAYGDPAVRENHLQLDPLPLLIPSVEWETINQALQQRADLLNRMLADLYGPRNLLTSGVLPADILFDHPHYHLPFHGLAIPGERHLHFYAAELIRSPQGTWWVKSDRTGAPGGSGFALENRIVISRAFPNEFRRCNVSRLAPYFIALREQLAGLAKSNQENPHIVILRAGAGSRNYFEDLFLAKYLGFTIAEPDDLVVRLGRLMLKTLGGLQPVDVIFRRQASHTLDPLELGGDAPGVPGILQVIRDGNVVMANAPGSGLVESPIFMAFMPRVCQALLNTDLQMPGVATWWGGEAASLELLLDRIDEVNLLPAFRVRTQGRSNPASLPSPQLLPTGEMSRDTKLELLKNEPAAWVGQEKVLPSTSAIWEEGRLNSGNVAIRTFLTASGDAWRSMPGGLVRISDQPQASHRNPFADGGTKDAWVLADKPVVPTSLLKQSGEFLTPTRGGAYLPSRVAENLCWLGRYLERADASARRLRTVVTRLTGETDPEDLVELPILIRTLALAGQVAVDYAIEDLSAELSPLELSLPQAALDPQESSSLRSQVGQVISLAGTVRDRLSTQAWQIIQDLGSDISGSEPPQCDLADLLDIVDTLIVDLAAFSGFVNEFMTRTEAFRFLNIGRRLEHAMQIVGLIKNCLADQTVVSGELLEAILEISDSVMTYRNRYFANIQLPAVLDLLLVDESNPRSLAFQLFKLNQNLELLPGNSGDELSEDRKLAQEALRSAQELKIVDLCELDAEGMKSKLTQFLKQVSTQLTGVFVSISNRFLVHSGPVHQMIANQITSSVPDAAASEHDQPNSSSEKSE